MSRFRHASGKGKPGRVVPAVQIATPDESPGRKLHFRRWARRAARRHENRTTLQSIEVNPQQVKLGTSYDPVFCNKSPMNSERTHGS